MKDHKLPTMPCRFQSSLHLLPLVLVLIFATASGQCPWSRELVDLHADCICAYNSVQRLSIQCSPVNFSRLMNALHQSVQNIPIDLLYINNSTIEILQDGIFNKLDIQSLHMARCKLKEISERAFQGLENSLNSLSIPDNSLKTVPMKSIERLTSLRQLDLSNNHLKEIPPNAFQNLPLTTLKLADNELKIHEEAFRGLETSLKNLNLKGTGQEKIPRAVLGLTSLAFLDLAQNKITKIEPGDLGNMHTLTALNMERNRIVKIGGQAFTGVNDTLSSLSLLNNLLVEFPLEALSSLTELRVLDLGFNGIRNLPDTAFSDNPFLTLLALDGNPMATVPLEPFKHLKATLRGLSIGGSYLECDCRIRWIAVWVQENDLQVTSRERNPQFCSKPEHLKRRSFFQIAADELLCDKTTSTTSTTTTAATTVARTSTTNTSPRTTKFFTTTTKQATRKSTTPPASSSSSTTTRRPPSSRREPAQSTRTIPVTSAPVAVSETSRITPPPPSQRPSGRQHSNNRRPSQPRSDDRSSKHNEIEDVKIVDAYRKDSSVIVEWDTETTNLLGFQVVYRLFGDKTFRRGPALRPEQKKYVLQNLPSNECIVVCVVTLEDSPDLSVDAVPYSQCREVKTERYMIAHLDKIIIASSAAVSGIIIIAVIIFLCCWRKKQRKDKPRLPPPTSAAIPAVKSDHEWETVSMYSGRSIPRARMYHMDNNVNANGSVNHSFVMDDNRSHISHFSHVPNGYPKTRSTADGQSHRSFSQLSNKYAHRNGGLGHPEVRKSQQSLSALSGHHSFLDSNMMVGAGHGKKKKTRSNGRLTSASSLHSLTEYDSDWNGNGRTENWKDNEVDIYVGQNHVVPTHGKYAGR